MALAGVSVHPSSTTSSPPVEPTIHEVESAVVEAPLVSPPSMGDMQLSQPGSDAAAPAEAAGAVASSLQQTTSANHPETSKLALEAPEERTSPAEAPMEEQSSRLSDGEGAAAQGAASAVPNASVQCSTGSEGDAGDSNRRERMAEEQKPSATMSEHQGDVVMTSAASNEDAAAEPEQPEHLEQLEQLEQRHPGEGALVVQERHESSTAAEPAQTAGQYATTADPKTSAVTAATAVTAAIAVAPAIAVNTETGGQPSITEITDLKWVTEFSRLLQTFKKLGHEQFKQLEIPQCRRCEPTGTNRKADVKCLDASCLLHYHPLCWDCWLITHSSSKTKTHRKTPTFNCPQCRLEHVAFWCSECDLTFCGECFSAIHSVQKVMHHRKFAMEDAPGSFLSKANWSQNFQAGFKEAIAARRKANGIASSSTSVSMANAPENKTDGIVGEKRKRAVKDTEVIVVDDSDEEEAEQEAAPALSDNSARQSVSDPPLSVEPSASISGLSQQNEAAIHEITPATHASGSEVYAALQTVQERAHLAASGYHAPAPVTGATEPIPFPPELLETESSSSNTASVSTGSFSSNPMPSTSPYTSSSMGRGMNASSFNNGAQYSWNSYLELQIPATSMPSSRSTRGMNYGAHGMASEPMNVQQHVPTPVDTTSGMWSSSSTITTDLATNNTLPLSSSVFAENVLVDAMADRYNEVNQKALEMEVRVESLTNEVAAATYQGSFAASQLMEQLNELQRQLAIAKAQRDNLLIAVILQSNDIMTSVRKLRLSSLSDVPQVPAMGHRKCFQMSFNINEQKQTLVRLNQRMANLLNEPNNCNDRTLSELIQCVSSDIQTCEQTIKRLKQARDMEIVRMVQFCHSLREGLKTEFQRINLQQQQQQWSMNPLYR